MYFRTMTQRLLADVACWTALIALMVYAIVTVENLILVGALGLAAAFVIGFALIYNGRNVATVVRSKLRSIRFEREERKREAEYAAELEREREEEARQASKDAALGRAIIDTISRYS